MCALGRREVPFLPSLFPLSSLRGIFKVSLKNGILLTCSLCSYPFFFQLQLRFLLHDAAMLGFPKISGQNL